jgi:hypothetical protein
MAAFAIATTATPTPRHQECDIQEVDDVINNADVAQEEPPQLPKSKRKKRTTNAMYVKMMAHLS